MLKSQLFPFNVSEEIDDIAVSNFLYCSSDLLGTLKPKRISALTTFWWKEIWIEQGLVFAFPVTLNLPLIYILIIFSLKTNGVRDSRDKSYFTILRMYFSVIFFQN